MMPEFVMVMEIKKVATAEMVELIVNGRVDGFGANRLEEEILAVVRDGADRIHVNLAHSDFLASAGVRVLLQYFKHMRAGKKTFYVTHPSPNIESVLAMTGLKDFIVWP
jgi:anti-anti-sigma factor